MNRINLFILTMLGMILLSFSACDGILEGIYDEAESTENVDFGFVDVNKGSNSGTIYIDATSYTRWTYINFHTLVIDSLNITTGGQEPAEWDIAIHRYDTRTNGGSVIDTGFTGFNALRSSGKMPEGTYVDDIWTTDKIAVDMSGMMDGNIVYSDSYYNPELSKWLNVDKSNMPPTYTLSNKVYVVKLKDGTHVAVRLSNYMSGAAVKGYMTIEYIYPFDL